MAKLVYSALCSVDGYVADASGDFGWAEPDEEVHAFVNELERGVGTYLLGRRMYEVLRVWDTMDDPHPVMRDYVEIWRAAEKVVFSRTLDAVTTTRTRLEREWDSEAVRRLVAGSERDVSVGGQALASSAFAAGLVGECHLFFAPVTVGGGTPALPRDLRVDLSLIGERRFRSGSVHLHYAVR